MSSIFGGKKSKTKSTQESHNQAYPYVQSTYAPVAETTPTTTSALMAALGLGGDASQAFDDYKNSAGYQSTLDAGSQAITGNAATKGLLNSGGTLKSLDQYGQGINQQYYSDYLNKLLGQAQLGLSAGQLISGAGNTSSGTSTSSSSEKPGLGKFLGAGLSFIPGAGAASSLLGA